MFSALRNTRDLGGLPTVDGRRIAAGKLLRSGNLRPATPEDLDVLSDRVALIVDLRTAQECSEEPDPAIPGVEYLHLPVIEQLAAGVTREKSSESLFEMLAKNPDMAQQFMRDNYIEFVTAPFSLAQYRRFVELLLVPREKAVLWHCSAGKDRTGFAAALILELLGVDRDTIMADYLKTNECQKDDLLRLYEMVDRAGGLNETTQKGLDCLFAAQAEYLAAVFDAIDARYGGMERFLTDQMGVGPRERALLKKLYLTE